MFLYRIKILPLSPLKNVIGLDLIAFFLFFLFLNIYKTPISENESALLSILMLNSQLLTTILAITLSISLFGMQYLAQQYTLRNIKEFYKDKFFIAFIFLYGIAIFFNLLAITFSKLFIPANCIPLSFILLTFCLIHLFFFPSYMISNIQPKKLLNRIKEKVPKDVFSQLNGTFWLNKLPDDKTFWLDKSPDRNRDPFINLELLLIQTIRNNDVEFFSQSMLFLKMQVIKMIERANEEYTNHQDLDKLAIRMDNIGIFIFHPYSIISNELFHNNNELMLFILINHLTEIIINLHKSYAIRSLKIVYQIYETIFFKTLENNILIVVDQFLKSITPIIEATIDAQNKISHKYNYKSGEYSQLTEKEKITRTFDEIMAEYLEGWEIFLGKAVRRAVDKKIDSIINLIMSIYSKIIDRILDIKDLNARNWILQSMLWNLKDVYKYCTENESHPKTFIISSLHYHIEKMQNLNYPINIQKMMVSEYCEMALTSVQKGDLGTIILLGENGRNLIEKPILLEYIIDVLEKGFYFLQENQRKNEIPIDYIVDQLRSFINWEKNLNTKISDRINHIIKNYGLEN